MKEVGDVQRRLFLPAIETMRCTPYLPHVIVTRDHAPTGSLVASVLVHEVAKDQALLREKGEGRREERGVFLCGNARLRAPEPAAWYRWVP